MSGSKRDVREVLPVVGRVVNLLAQYTTRIAVAGSIRRGEAMVGDIEIVCQPVGDKIDRLCDKALRHGWIEQRRKSNGHLLAWGSRYKAFTFEGVPVDLFCVLPDRQWGPTFLIRTGPGSANDCLVTREGIRNREGRLGVLPDLMQFKDGGVWRLPSPQTPLPQGEGLQRLDTPEEGDVFAACGLPYVPPPLRSYELYRALAKGEPMPPFEPRWRDGRDDYFLPERNGYRRKLITVQVGVAEAIDPPLEQGSLF